MKKGLSVLSRAWSFAMVPAAVALFCPLIASALPIITSVVETGGDNEATDTVTAKWTGVTFSNGVAGEFLDPFTVPTFNEDVPAYVDRTHQWNGATTTLPLPSYLVDAEYIMIGNDNRDNTSLRLDVTVSEPAIVYLLIDNRLTDGNAADPPESGLPLTSWTGMAWVGTDGFAPVLNGLNRNSDPSIPDEVGVDEGGNGVGPGGDIQNYSSVYSKTVPAGSFSLFQADNAGRNMYGVVVKRAPGSPNSPPGIVNLTPTNNTLFYNPASGVSFTATTVAPNRIEATNVSLSLNGVDLSSSLAIGGNPTSRTASYSSLKPDTLYRGQIIVSDQAGRATTNNFSFDTFSAATTVTVEAEDYNYAGGKFLDAPPAAGYAGLTGTAEIDYHDNNVTVLATQYRTSDFVGLAVGTDAERQKFTGVGATDYQVSQIQAGDWLNYTRTVNSNTYNVYLRASSPGAQQVRLDRITGDPATLNQVPFALGSFAFPTAAGPTPFVYVPLADASGNPLALELSGTNTFRLTALSANLNLQLNFLLFVPTTAAARPPYLSEASPAFGAVNVAPDAVLKITLVHGTTPAAPGSVVLTFNGSNVTSAASVSPVADGVVVTYDPPGLLATNTVYPVSLVFGDTGGASFTNQWTFTTVPSINLIPANYGTPPGSGQGSGFRLKIRKAPNSNQLGTAFTLANTALRAEQQLADQLIDPDTTQPYVNEAAGPNNDGLGTNGVINFDQAGNTAGYFPGDVPFPYLDPALFADPNNLAMEVTAYLELTAGIYRFGVRSDDGFKLTAGPVLTDTNLVLGIYEGGRGDGLPGGANEFDFLVESSGVYPFRLIYYEGNGDARVELYSVDRTTFKRTLINDPNSPGAIKAFTSRTAQVYVPTVFITSPANKVIYASVPTNITITADASVVNGRIRKVEFFYGATNRIGEATSVPYSVVWSNVDYGRYALTAKATDTNDLTAVSAPVNIIVGTPLISNVVETGGDDEATDTIRAQWTDVTFSNGVDGEFLTPFTVPTFGEDVPAFVDRTHQWNGATPTLPLPSYLVGGEYIMSGNDNRDNTPYQLDITLAEEANVYLLVDNRLGEGNNADPPNYPDWQGDLTGDGLPDMAWLLPQGWKPVTNGLNRAGNAAWPDEVGVDEGGDGTGPGVAINQWSSVYVKRIPAGTFSIYQADNTGQNMYGVVVTRVPRVVPRPVFGPPSLNGTALTLSWTGGGRLQEAPEVTGSWSDVAGNPKNSFTVQTTEPRKFYRVVVP